jgi:hypothetical protein
MRLHFGCLLCTSCPPCLLRLQVPARCTRITDPSGVPFLSVFSVDHGRSLPAAEPRSRAHVHQGGHCWAEQAGISFPWLLLYVAVAVCVCVLLTLSWRIPVSDAHPAWRCVSSAVANSLNSPHSCRYLFFVLLEQGRAQPVPDDSRPRAVRRW